MFQIIFSPDAVIFSLVSQWRMAGEWLSSLAREPLLRAITCVSLEQDPISPATASLMLGNLTQLNVLPSPDTTDHRNYHTSATPVPCTTMGSKCLTLICPPSKTRRKKFNEIEQTSFLPCLLLLLKISCEYLYPGIYLWVTKVHSK